MARWTRAPASGEPLAFTECPFRGPARVTLLSGLAAEDTFPVRLHEETHAAQCDSLGPLRYRMKNLTSRGRLSLEAPAYCAGAAARIRQGQDSARVRERLHDDATAAFRGRLDSAIVTAALRSSCPPLAVPKRPIVIAHRGASGHRPEHTLEAYALAIAMGADYIEPDLVSTRDGVLVARHENEIGGTTDVASKYPSRRTTRVIDGDTVSGWFTEDFTLAELRTLRARERLAFRSHEFDGRFAVPTFDDILALADSAGRRRGRVVGVYPEIKHPAYFRRIGLPLEEKLLASLARRGLDRRDAPVFIQSFDSASLQALRPRTRVRLVQLVFDTGQVTPPALREIAKYADAIGANTRLVVPATAGGRPSSLIADAHALGLLVHVWTLRPEPQFLAARYASDPLAEVRELAALGVDGMFGDHPDLILKGLARD